TASAEAVASVRRRRIAAPAGDGRRPAADLGRLRLGWVAGAGPVAGAGDLLRGNVGVFAAPEADSYAGRDASGGLVYDTYYRRGDGGGCSPFILVAGVFDVPVSKSRHAQALY